MSTRPESRRGYEACQSDSKMQDQLKRDENGITLSAYTLEKLSRSMWNKPEARSSHQLWFWEIQLRQNAVSLSLSLCIESESEPESESEGSKHVVMQSRGPQVNVLWRYLQCGGLQSACLVTFCECGAKQAVLVGTDAKRIHARCTIEISRNEMMDPAH